MKPLVWVIVCVGLAGCSPTIVVGSEGQALTVQSRSCEGAPDYQRTASQGHCLRWNTRHLTWQLGVNGNGSPGDDAGPAVARAFSNWARATEGCSDWSFDEGVRLEHPLVANDGLVVVVFRQGRCLDVAPMSDPCWDDLSCPNAYNCWGGDPSTLGLTTTTYSRSTGLLLDADVELTTKQNFSAPEWSRCSTPRCFDLEGTVTHELGHLLGLDHTREGTTFSTMTPSANEPSQVLTLRSIDASSQCFVCDSYPAGRAAKDCAP